MAVNKYLALRDRRVTKSNDLIQQSRFCLTLQQQKCILYIISQIDFRDDDFRIYDFSIQEFCKVCGIETDGRTYKYLKDALLGIRNAGIWITMPNGKERTLAWIEKAEVDSGSGTVRVRLDEDMKPYLLHLKNNFTSYDIVYTLHFKSKYSIRLYELIKSIHFRDIEPYQQEFTLDELKLRMDAQRYKEYKNFKARALDPAVKEINAYSDKAIEYTEIKRGLKVESILFAVKTKSAMERIEVRDQIDKDMGLFPGQMTLWEEMLKNKKEEPDKI